MSQTSLAFPSTRFTLDPATLQSDEERAVYRALRVGRENARKVPDLAAEAGVSPREFQKVVERLVLERGVPIGTAMSRPFGNYLIDTADELAATVDLLRARGIQNLRRAAALKGMSFARYMAEVQTEAFDEPTREVA